MYRVLIVIGKNKSMNQAVVDSVLNLPGTSEELEVFLLSVEQEYGTSGDGAYVESGKPTDKKLDEVLNTAAEWFEATDVSIERKRTKGDPAESILETAKSVNADCIAIGGQKRSPTGKVLFGDITQSVLLNAECPVLVTMNE